MHRRIFALGLMAFFFANSAAPQKATAGAVKAFTNARIIDGTGKPAIERGTILVRNGRIEQAGPSGRVQIPAEAERIDASGKTIVPGIINAHGHVGEAQGLESGPPYYTEENVLRQLGLYARYGVTTVFSLGGDRELALRLRSEQDAPGLKRARIYVAGPVVTSKTPLEARK